MARPPRAHRRRHHHGHRADRARGIPTRAEDARLVRTAAASRIQLINPEERMATVIRKDHEKDWAASRAGTFGEILLRAGILSEADIDRVLTAQKESGRRFGETAVSLGLIQEADVRRVLARQFDHASVSPEHSSIVPSLFSAFTAT